MKRMLSILLVLVMCLSLLPLAALAEEVPAAEEAVLVEEALAVEPEPMVEPEPVIAPEPVARPEPMVIAEPIAAPESEEEPAEEPEEAELTLDGAGSVPIDAAHFPDENFCAFVSKYYDRNYDGVLSESEIADVTLIKCGNKKIKSLQGIEYFTALQYLKCGSNQLTSLDVSKNTALTNLACLNNQLTSIDVSKNTALKNLDCSGNPLTSLDMSKNANLELLYCSGCQLTSLDLSSNPKLYDLHCDANGLTALDLSANPALQYLWCYDNQLTALNLSENHELASLHCYNNQLTELELGSVKLEYLKCYNNRLTALDLSGCSVLEELRCYNNELAALDLTACSALYMIECDNNKLTAFELSDCVNLYLLSCTNNQLTALDVSGLSQLSYIWCDNNRLTSLGLSACDPSSLTCSNNQLTSLDLSACERLWQFECYGNQITSLDISSCSELVYMVSETRPLQAGRWECDPDHEGVVDEIDNNNLYCDIPMEFIYDGASHWISGEFTRYVSFDTIRLSIQVEDQVYTGEPLTPPVTVKLRGVTLEEGTDYTVEYYNNTKAGEARVEITGIGQYYDCRSGYFAIKPAPIEITASSKYASYSADAQKVKLGATASAGKLTYSSSDSAVTVTAKGTVKLPAGFVGSVTITLTVTPKTKNYEPATKTVKVTVLKAPKLTSVTSDAPKQLTAKWKKISSASGYEVQCCKKKAFSSAVKTVTAKKAATTSKTVTLKAGDTKYFVRVRAYKVKDGVKYYSDWSNIKSVKVK